MFFSSKPLLKKARRYGYALPGFNTSNLEVTQALFKAAHEAKAPLLVQTTESTIKYAGLEAIFSLISSLERQSSVPVCIHLDHGKDIELIKRCLKLGYKSVMIDASRFPFEKNVAITKLVVAFAHRKRASVEAELGTLERPGKANLTDAERAKDFVEKTNCDALAVAIGTSHGAFKFEDAPRLDLERLKEISECVSVPLVLHGGSSVPKAIVNKANVFGALIQKAKGVPEKQVKKAVKLGVAKVNIDTDLRLVFTASLREFLAKNPKEFDLRNYLSQARNAVKELALEKMRLLGCAGKAVGPA